MPLVPPMLRSPGRRLAALLLAGISAACSGPELTADPGPAGLSCVDDSPECVGRRQTALRQLVAAEDRAWVRQPATPAAYASGVRLFAFKAKKRELSCEELAHGRREADGAAGALKGAGAGLTPAQVSRGTMLAAEVSRELGNELGRRCRKS
jgi:hypothetical protein